MAATGFRMSKPAGRTDAGTQPFSVYFTSADRKADLLTRPDVIAVVEFGDSVGKSDGDPRLISVGLPQLGTSQLLEVWTSETPIETGRRGQVSYVSNNQVLIGHLAFDDREYPNLEAATRTAYETFLPLAGEMGFPHYLRIWNYIPDINGEEHGIERYKSFCIGRHAVFERFTLAEKQFPAASCVGGPPGRMLIHFLAAREAGTQVENSRQVSAFHYPPQYGPRSPAFSRAVVKNWGQNKHLYISGTASIVGHQSQHRDRAIPQLMESLRNVSTLVGSAATEHGLAIRSPADLTQIKVYLRNLEDHAAIRDSMHAELGEGLPVLYLASDLCRRNLLVEIEGLYAG